MPMKVSGIGAPLLKILSSHMFEEVAAPRLCPSY